MSDKTAEVETSHSIFATHRTYLPNKSHNMFNTEARVTNTTSVQADVVLGTVHQDINAASCSHAALVQRQL